MTYTVGLVPGFSYLYSVSMGQGKVSEREMSFITEIRVSQCSKQSPAGKIYKNKCFSTFALNVEQCILSTLTVNVCLYEKYKDLY